MFSSREIIATLESVGISHLIWVPDSTTGAWERDLEASSQLQLVRVCREGEAWTLAAGLHVGGKIPLIVMQSTGFFESSDSMRNVLYDLRLPLLALVGVRNWLNPDSTDSARRFAEPLARAWGLDCVWIQSESDKPKMAAHFRGCLDRSAAGVVMMAEGKG